MTNSLKKGHIELIRDINMQSVLRTVQDNETISRASIAGQLGLTKATVSSIVQTLLEKDLLLELGSDDTKKGRKPILYKLNDTCGYCVTADLSHDQFTVMLSNLIGTPVSITSFPLQKQESDLIAFVISCIEKTIKNLPECTYGLLGISIGIHGVVHHNRIIFLPYSDYEETDFVTPLEAYFHVPVILENEANLSVLGEWSYLHNTNEMLYISIHTGIGVGIIMRNQLVKGKQGYAGEFGHTIIQTDGRPCPCGNHGCLEQYASERAVFQELSEIIDQPVDSTIFAELYRQKHPDALRLTEQFIKYMAAGVNNLLNSYNPDIMVLNSFLLDCEPALCEKISSHLHSRMKQYCTLIPSKLKDHAVLYGGSFLIRQQFLYSS